MREQARSSDVGLGDTWKGQVVASPERTTVRTIQVKSVGTPRRQPASSRVDFATTQRFGSPPSSMGDAAASVRSVTEHQDNNHPALAFARTIPALTPEELGLRSSGVREIERLQLWLEPRDRAAFAAPSGDPRSRSYAGTTTLRISANPLARACQLGICAAATVCILSALALGLLTN